MERRGIGTVEEGSSQRRQRVRPWDHWIAGLDGLAQCWAKQPVSSLGRLTCFRFLVCIKCCWSGVEGRAMFYVYVSVVAWPNKAAVLLHSFNHVILGSSNCEFR